MKKILYTLFVLFICSCSDDGSSKAANDMNFTGETAGNPGQSANTNGSNTISIIGKWIGILNCPACCDEEYLYEFDINQFNQQNGEITATLTITVLEGSTIGNEYAKYNCEGEFSNDKLVVNTTGIIEKNENSCYFCEGNSYEFLVDNNNDLEGNWLSSSNCDTSTINNSTITIKKQ